MASNIVNFTKLFYISLAIIFVSSLQKGCQVIENIEKDCQKTCHDNDDLCFVQEMELLSINRTITIDKFFDFIHLYTVNETNFETFKLVVHNCTIFVKHDPPTNDDVENFLECFLLPPTALEGALGCNFTHPL